MTWLKARLPVANNTNKVNWDLMLTARRWCEHNLSSSGVLWKHSSTTDWAVFCFAQEQDLIVFKLKFGC